MTLGLVHHTLLLDGVPLAVGLDLSRDLVTRLQTREIQGVTFLKGYTREELRHFVELLGEDIQGDRLGQDLKKRGVSHILLVQLGTERVGEARPAVDLVDRVGAGPIYIRTLQTIRKVFHEARLGKVPSLSEVQRRVEELVVSLLKRKNSLMALTMIKSDEYLFNHWVNVGILAIALGKSVGLGGTALRELALGALLHDLGKVHLPAAITRKPGNLTEEEWQLVKRHPEDGMWMLEQMGVQAEIALRAVKEHHVRFDRTGYPTLAPGEDAHPHSMIVTIADTYDAMTTVRPYRRDFHPSQAIAQMKAAAGSHFEPEKLERFVEMVEIYPPGTVVRLTTGEIAVVTRPGTEDTARPWVWIVYDRQGDPGDGAEVNLMEWDPETGDYLRSIQLAVDPTIRGIDVAAVLQRKGFSPEGWAPPARGLPRFPDH